LSELEDLLIDPEDDLLDEEEEDLIPEDDPELLDFGFGALH